MRSFPLILLCVCVLMLDLSCGPKTITRVQAADAGSLDPKAEYLKAYTAEGDLYILHDWKVEGGSVRGVGVRLNKDRDTVEKREFDLPASKVSLFETNTLGISFAASGIVAVAVANALLTVYCIMNPKACFGSCPTFYVNDGSGDALMAEGFSSSILPSLEAEDIDALPRAVPRGRTLEVTMKNEALETHVVRSVDIMAVPHHAGNRIFKTDDGRFYESSAVLSPAKAIGLQGDVTNAVRALDGVEQHSRSDSNDLAKKETVDLFFAPEETGSYGLVVGCRQAFVSTYLFYQGMSYLGTHAGEYLARAERHEAPFEHGFDDFTSHLGGVAVWSEDENGAWQKEGEVTEMGPIATDIHLITITASNKPRHLRIQMPQGGWRIDYLALAKLAGEVQPIVLHPTRREHTANQVFFTDTAQWALRPASLDDALVTLPGDAYRYTFELPEHPERYELFLRSKGYYLEWLREDWLREEDLAKAALFFLDPTLTLRTCARGFKAIEEEMETEFWRTKISHNIP